MTFGHNTTSEKVLSTVQQMLIYFSWSKNARARLERLESYLIARMNRLFDDDRETIAPGDEHYYRVPGAKDC